MIIIFLFIITIGLFSFGYISYRNYFNKQQEKINTSASNINVQLVQRRDTLLKLVDATKSHMKFEKDVMTDVTKLRNMNLNHVSPEELSKVGQQLDATRNNLIANIENYPDLKSSVSITQLMNAIDINEREIAASRRLYNADVNEFNQNLFIFPKEFVAARNKLHTLPLFVASEEQKKDVKIDLY